MYKSTQESCGCATHQRDVSFSLTRLIDLVLARFSVRSRVRLAADDLPDDLRRDIGLGGHRTSGSFEERWRAELRNMRR